MNSLISVFTDLFYDVEDFLSSFPTFFITIETDKKSDPFIYNNFSLMPSWL